jgi:hypothetical protein
MPELFTWPVQEVVRQPLIAVSRDQARVIAGTVVKLAMTALLFVPMFLKRLMLNRQASQAAQDKMSRRRRLRTTRSQAWYRSTACSRSSFSTLWSAYFVRFYSSRAGRIERYPPGTPFFEKTSCHICAVRDRDTPAAAKR